MKKLVILSCVLLLSVGLTIGGCAKKEEPSVEESAAAAIEEKVPTEETPAE